MVAVRDACRAARVALVVDAFRRERGRLPKSLDEIGREAMPGIPRDVVRGEPLVYVVEQDGFAVCPSRGADRERMRLARLVKERDAIPAARRPAEIEANDGNEDGAAPDDEDIGDEYDFRSGAFRVVYPRGTQTNGDDGGKDR